MCANSKHSYICSSLRLILLLTDFVNKMKSLDTVVSSHLAPEVPVQQPEAKVFYTPDS